MKLIRMMNTAEATENLEKIQGHYVDPWEYKMEQ